jgi:hypothetical protein
MNALRATTFDRSYDESVVSSDEEILMVRTKRLPDEDVRFNTDVVTIPGKAELRVIPKPLSMAKNPNVAARPFYLIQQWEGKVSKTLADSFVATLEDKTTPTNPGEEVEIELSEISEEDRALVRSGAFFYWSVGYEDAPGVPRQRVSRIRFRRLPGWTSREIERAKKSSEQFADLF